MGRHKLAKGICQCGAAVLCVKTGECSRCYQRNRKEAIAKGTHFPAATQATIEFQRKETERLASRELNVTRRAEILKAAAAESLRLREIEQAARRERAERWAEEIMDGSTLEAIGKREGLSRERVRQILHKHGLPSRRPHRTVAPKLRDRFKTLHTILLNLQSNIDQRGPDECWPWTGSLVNSCAGRTCRPMLYGRIRAFDPLDAEEARGTFAHRAVYLLFKGPIPAGMTVDHICFNPSCCNPAHLQLLTLGENSARKSPEWYAVHAAKRGKKNSLGPATLDGEPSPISSDEGIVPTSPTREGNAQKEG